MPIDIQAASGMLSRLELNFELDNLRINVLWFRVMKVQGVWDIPRHTHSSYEFHFVHSGACRVRLDGREFVARAGEFYLTSPHVYHEQSSEGEGEYTEYSINYDILALDGNSTEGSSLLNVLEGADCMSVTDAFGGIDGFGRALEEAYYQQLGYYNNIKALAQQILIAAARALRSTHSVKYAVPLKASGADCHFAEIEKFVKDNVCTHLTAGDLASHMYISSRQVSRIIRQCSGKSPKQYINSIKLIKAKAMLSDPHLTIKQVSDQLGFTSEYYFSQFFKREEGYAPLVFKKNTH